MVDGTVNLAVNCGVVGALILSILIPYSIERAELSEDGWSFLGDDHFPVVSWILRAVFLICLNVAIVVSLLSVFVASLILVCLSSWAASLEFKIQWHVERVSTIRYQAVLMWQTLGWLIGTVFAGGLLADPMQGGIGLIALIVFEATSLSLFLRECNFARAALHREAVEFFEKAGGMEGGQSAVCPHTDREGGQHQRQIAQRSYRIGHCAQ